MVTGAMDFGISDHCEGACCEQAAEISIALLADAAEPLLAATRALLRYQPDPSREVAARPEGPWISDAGNQCGSQGRPYARELIEVLAHLVRSMPGRDHSVEVQNLCFDHPELTTEGGNTRARKLRQAPIMGIANNTKQLFDASAPDRRNDAKLGKMSADRVNH